MQFICVFYIGVGLDRAIAFERVGLFDSELKVAEDTDWFHRAHQANLGLLRVPEVTLLRHSPNMVSGKSLAELNTLRVFKKQLDRRRQEKIAFVESSHLPSATGKI